MADVLAGSVKSAAGPGCAGVVLRHLARFGETGDVIVAALLVRADLAVMDKGFEALQVYDIHVLSLFVIRMLYTLYTKLHAKGYNLVITNINI